MCKAYILHNKIMEKKSLVNSHHGDPHHKWVITSKVKTSYLHSVQVNILVCAWCTVSTMQVAPNCIYHDQYGCQLVSEQMKIT